MEALHNSKIEFSLGIIEWYMRESLCSQRVGGFRHLAKTANFILTSLVYFDDIMDT